MRVVVTDAAKADLVAIRGYLRERNPNAAHSTGAELGQACLSLSSSPERGRPGLVTGTREIVVGGYVVVYRVLGSSVQILRIWHRAQDRSGG